MKTILGTVLILGALGGLLVHANAWACVGMAVLGGVLVDAADVTKALQVVAPMLPGKLGQRLSGQHPFTPSGDDAPKAP